MSSLFLETGVLLMWTMAGGRDTKRYLDINPPTYSLQMREDCLS